MAQTQNIWWAWRVPSKPRNVVVRTNQAFPANVSFGPYGSKIENCNWMPFVRRTFNQNAANLLGTFVKGEIYFTTIRRVKRNEEFCVYMDIKITKKFLKLNANEFDNIVDRFRRITLKKEDTDANKSFNSDFITIERIKKVPDPDSFLDVPTLICDNPDYFADVLSENISANQQPEEDSSTLPLKIESVYSISDANHQDDDEYTTLYVRVPKNIATPMKISVPLGTSSVSISIPPKVVDGKTISNRGSESSDLKRSDSKCVQSINKSQTETEKYGENDQQKCDVLSRDDHKSDFAKSMDDSISVEIYCSNLNSQLSVSLEDANDAKSSSDVEKQLMVDADECLINSPPNIFRLFEQQKTKPRSRSKPKPKSKKKPKSKPKPTSNQKPELKSTSTSKPNTKVNLDTSTTSPIKPNKSYDIIHRKKWIIDNWKTQVEDKIVVDKEIQDNNERNQIIHEVETNTAIDDFQNNVQRKETFDENESNNRKPEQAEVELESNRLKMIRKNNHWYLVNGICERQKEDNISGILNQKDSENTKPNEEFDAHSEVLEETHMENNTINYSEKMVHFELYHKNEEPQENNEREILGRNDSEYLQQNANANKKVRFELDSENDESQENNVRTILRRNDSENMKQNGNASKKVRFELDLENEESQENNMKRILRRNDSENMKQSTNASETVELEFDHQNKVLQETRVEIFQTKISKKMARFAFDVQSEICEENDIIEVVDDEKLDSAKSCIDLPQFKCLQCGRGYQFEDSLTYHKCKSKNNVLPYNCSKCRKSYNLEDSLKYHLCKEKKIEDSFKELLHYKCKLCDKTYELKESLEYHQCKKKKRIA